MAELLYIVRSNEIMLQMGYSILKKSQIRNIIKVLNMASKDRLPSNIQYKNSQLQLNNDSSSSSNDDNNISSSHMQDEVSGSNYDINQQDYYEVEKILGKRLRNGKPEYLVKWKDWDKPQHNTWENMSNLKNVKHLVQEYEDQLKTKKSETSKPIRKQDKAKNIQEKLKQYKQLVQTKGKKSQAKLSKPQNIISEKDNKQKDNKQKDNKQKDNKQKDKKQKDTKLDKPVHQQQNKRTNQINIDSQSQNDYNQKNVSTQLSKNNHSQPKKITKVQPPPLPRLESHPSFKSIDSKNYMKNSAQGQLKTKPTLRLGSICNHFVEGGRIYYQCNIVNRQNNIIGVKKIQGSQLKNNEPEKLRQYLEQALVDYDRYYEMNKQYKNQIKSNVSK